MQTLLNLQLARLNKILQTEEEVPGLTLDHVSKEIALALDIAKEILQLKQSLGITPKQAQKIAIATTTFNLDDLINRVRETRATRGTTTNGTTTEDQNKNESQAAQQLKQVIDTITQDTEEIDADQTEKIDTDTDTDADQYRDWETDRKSVV